MWNTKFRSHKKIQENEIKLYTGIHYTKFNYQCPVVTICITYRNITEICILPRDVFVRFI